MTGRRIALVVAAAVAFVFAAGFAIGAAAMAASLDSEALGIEWDDLAWSA